MGYLHTITFWRLGPIFGENKNRQFSKKCKVVIYRAGVNVTTNIFFDFRAFSSKNIFGEKNGVFHENQCCQPFLLPE
jgi:hypothetical protein